jgi:hypothetical protein
MASHKQIVDDAYKTPLQSHLSYKDKTAVVTGLLGPPDTVSL